MCRVCNGGPIEHESMTEPTANLRDFRGYSDVTVLQCLLANNISHLVETILKAIA